MKKKDLLKLINECYCDVVNKSQTKNKNTVKLAEDQFDRDATIISTGLRDIKECVDIINASAELSEKNKFLDRIIKTTNVVKGILNKNTAKSEEPATTNSTTPPVKEGANDVYSEVGTWRRLLIKCENQEETYASVLKYFERKQYDFPSVTIKVIKSTVKPDLVVADLNGPNALVLAKKAKGELERDKTIKVVIRDDVKLKPKQ